MNTLQNYFQTNLFETQNDVVLNALTKNIRYETLRPYKGAQDPHKFDDQTYNADIFIKQFNIDGLTAMSTLEYYDKYFMRDEKNFNSLTISEKANFDATHGDIIIVDDNGNVKYNIDLKISNKYLGAINLGSLVKFNENGYYILINLTNKQFKILTHKQVVDTVNAQKIRLNPPVKGRYVGYNVKWNNETLTSEYFLKGVDLSRL